MSEYTQKYKKRKGPYTVLKYELKISNLKNSYHHPKHSSQIRNIPQYHQKTLVKDGILVSQSNHSTNLVLNQNIGHELRSMG